MRTHPVAKRYATALFELAVEKNQLENIRSELCAFAELLESQSRFKTTLLTPGIDKRQKENAVEQVLNSSSTLFVNFMLLMIQKGRQNIVADVVEEFGRLYEKKMRRLTATITSATELDGPTLEHVEKKLSSVFKSHILLNHKVDPSLLGGFIVEVDGMALDGSLKRQLNLLRAKLIKTRAA